MVDFRPDFIEDVRKYLERNFTNFTFGPGFQRNSIAARVRGREDYGTVIEINFNRTNGGKAFVVVSILFKKTVIDREEVVTNKFKDIGEGRDGNIVKSIKAWVTTEIQKKANRYR